MFLMGSLTSVFPYLLTFCVVSVYVFAGGVEKETRQETIQPIEENIIFYKNDFIIQEQECSHECNQHIEDKILPFYLIPGLVPYFVFVFQDFYMSMFFLSSRGNKSPPPRV